MKSRMLAIEIGAERQRFFSFFFLFFFFSFSFLFPLTFFTKRKENSRFSARRRDFGRRVQFHEEARKKRAVPSSGIRNRFSSTKNRCRSNRSWQEFVRSLNAFRLYGNSNLLAIRIGVWRLRYALSWSRVGRAERVAREAKSVESISFG